MFPHYPHDVNQPLEIKCVHGHEEESVKVTRQREAVGTAENVLITHDARFECRVALAETAKLALAGTARNLDADLRKDNAVIVEPPPRD